MTTGKTIALTKRAFVGKVISLLFNMLSSFSIAFLSTRNSVFISHFLSLPISPLSPAPGNLYSLSRILLTVNIPIEGII